jgi:hypothetical protein
MGAPDDLRYDETQCMNLDGGTAMSNFDVLMLLGFVLPGVVICLIHRHLTRKPR